MTTPSTPRQTRPRWPALLLLSLAVLGVHALLLTGGLSSLQPASPQPSKPDAAQEITLQTTALPAVAQATPQRLSGLSTVRWLPPPPAAQASVAEAAPPRPATQPVPQPNKPIAQPPVAAPPNPAQQALPNPEAPALENLTVLDVLTPNFSVEPLPEPPVATTMASETGRPAEPAEPQVDLPAPDPTAAAEADDIQLAAARTARPARGDTRLPPATPPASAQLDYTVTGKAKGLAYSATGRLDWSASSGAYNARMEIRVFLLGSRVQTSQGTLAASGLQPQRFGDKSRSERAAHFDQTLGRIRFSNNAPDAELLPGAQDRLSVFFQLAGLLNARPEAYAAGQSVAVPVAGTGGSEVWRFEVQGLETLNLPAGELIARHLVREPRQAYDTRVDIWLAPSLGHLPVRIRITQDNGDVVDQRLSALP